MFLPPVEINRSQGRRHFFFFLHKANKIKFSPGNQSVVSKVLLSLSLPCDLSLSLSSLLSLSGINYSGNIKEFKKYISQGKMEKDVLHKGDRQRAPETFVSLLWHDGVFLWFCHFVDMCFAMCVFSLLCDPLTLSKISQYRRQQSPKSQIKIIFIFTVSILPLTQPLKKESGSIQNLMVVYFNHNICCRCA